ncbi:DUF72 domain-containing protein [Pedobacter sp. HMF7647]|uniref:DUF72 domain-containing protein n=1 Tax=Hufsiella arboris TaxID=2695275 RepID=A0A7K1YEU3_9SPHI|nr:DUF72 domain-containing protein [Hufsiella arboris]MXV53115.1 DUF72 domain-containing protein [Hufsiella arboris]
MNCFVGCSGFYYPEWKGVFYPEESKKKDWLHYYARHFQTLEINNTFYRFPELKTFEEWYKKSPDNFLFSVKVPRIITQYRRFNDCSELIQSFYNLAAAGLMEKLGCILFQLPPSMAYSEQLLHKIINSLDLTFKNVVEFRHVSWYIPKVYEELKKANVAFCGVSYPTLSNKVTATASFLYYRFHGVPELYKSAYSNEELQNVASAIITANLNEAWVYFNNTMNVEAIQNALTLEKILEGLLSASL